MTCPQKERWHLLSLELLDEQEAEALRAHARECAPCHAACQAARRDHARLLRAFEVFDRDDDQFREQLIAALPQALAGAPAPGRPLRVRRWLGDFAMATNYRPTRWLAFALAPAACVALVLILVLTGTPRIAFAQVVERMRAARTLLCQVTTTTEILADALPGQEPERVSLSTLKMYSDGQTRAWLYEQEENGQHICTLMRPEGSYVSAGDRQYTFTQAEPPAHGEGMASPTEWVEHLLKVTEEPDRRLGEEQIAGRPAVGFEIAGWKLGYSPRPTDATGASDTMQVRVWVDTKTRLPVRFETDMIWSAPASKLHITSRWDDLKWDVPLDAAQFEPPATAFAPDTPRVDLPAINELSAIEALRAWLAEGEQARATFVLLDARAAEKGEPLPAELETSRVMAALDSAFPDRLDISWLMSSFATRAAMAGLKEQLATPPPMPENMTDQERAAFAKQRARDFAKQAGETAGRATARIMPLAAFYQKLANDDRNPEYFGPDVTPGDATAVLLRWRTEDGLRVIYGDLHVETVATNP